MNCKNKNCLRHEPTTKGNCYKTADQQLKCKDYKILFIDPVTVNEMWDLFDNKSRRMQGPCQTA